ncbi:Endonuclease/exonuclease/phosphatase [Fimicolochytrium jonesii]|uniref:Endonuclease/exonuclease/phosphatase n=1 Tax=Fimicolochytrium jonesii TaxID=1396493 RepID=UPI0022FDF2DA|nr:Endonuclease/exonuclease/phosphatase [Fimicolochytrium jonesii]KAI8822130.1 Endonuclease/exonuclease/phosphatase [Fimicolochytrium jonesii]
MKISRSNTDSDLALIPGYDAFFTYPKRRHGYSGVTTYARSKYTPVNAEEGFTGTLCNPATCKDPIGSYGDMLQELTPEELLELDSEGRVMITDHRLFVLINVRRDASDILNERSDMHYGFRTELSAFLGLFPGDGSRACGIQGQSRFYGAMKHRIEALLAAGREVILVGDINACYSPMDHCDPKKSLRENGITEFHDTPTRRWLYDFLHPRGPLYDTFRVFHPTQEKAFTCWNTLLNARPVNYGTRIDFILCSKGVLPWIKDSTVEATIMGSDHCPVACVLYDTHPTTGQSLAEAMNPPGWTGERVREPVKLCVKYWDEFSGRQQKLSSFFVKKGAGGVVEAAAGKAGVVETFTKVESSNRDDVANGDVGAVGANVVAAQEVAWNASKDSTLGPKPPITLARKVPRPDKKPTPPTRSGSYKPIPKGQKTIGSFFAPRSTPSIPPPPEPDVAPPSQGADPTSSQPFSQSQLSTDTDVTCYSSPVDSQTDSQPDSLSLLATPEAATQWRALLNPKAPPTCYHNEPTKQWKVNKPGPNHGRAFYLCQRPIGAEVEPVVGAGDEEEERGTGQEKDPKVVWRSRKKVGEHRCDFFQWKNPPKRSGRGAVGEGEAPAAKKFKR